MMRESMKAKAILDDEFLSIRARILDIAAAFDRMERAEGDLNMDERMQKLLEALTIAGDADSDRAERIQMLFSRTYDRSWKSQLEMPARTD